MVRRPGTTGAMCCRVRPPLGHNFHTRRWVSDLALLRFRYLGSSGLPSRWPGSSRSPRWRCTLTPDGAPGWPMRMRVCWRRSPMRSAASTVHPGPRRLRHRPARGLTSRLRRRAFKAARPATAPTSPRPESPATRNRHGPMSEWYKAWSSHVTRRPRDGAPGRGSKSGPGTPALVTHCRCWGGRTYGGSPVSSRAAALTASRGRRPVGGVAVGSNRIVRDGLPG